MATKTGIELKRTVLGWQAPCGCLFHIFDGLPMIEVEYQTDVQMSLTGDRSLKGQTVLIGKLAPHWHPCKKHEGDVNGNGTGN